MARAVKKKFYRRKTEGTESSENGTLGEGGKEECLKEENRGNRGF